MSGTQQTEMLNLGLDCFQDRAKHSVRHLLMSIDLIFPSSQNLGCEIPVFIEQETFTYKCEV